MTGMLFKNSLMKIKKSFGRFISLFIIVMVGVGFFAGIRESAPDIEATLDQYNSANKVMDFQIVSTLGLTDADVKALKTVNHIKSVQPGYSLDVLVQGKAVRVHAIDTSVNTIRLMAGRMPTADNECVADSRTYKIGDTVHIESDVSDKLKNKQFRVVGTAESPLYLSKDYGTTTVGDGKLSSFLFIGKTNFTLDAYTQIAVTCDGADGVGAFSEQYSDITAQVNNELLKMKSGRETARYQEIYQKAFNEISTNEKKLKDEKAKAEKELSDAKAKLDDSSLKLSSAKKQLAKNEADLQKKTRDQNAEFQTAKEKIADGWKQIDSALQSNGLTREDVNAKVSALNSGIQAMKAQQNALPSDSPEYSQLGAQIGQYSAMYQDLVKLQTSIQTLTAQETQLNTGISVFQAQIAKAEQKIADGKAELAKNGKKLADGYTEYNKNADEFHTKMADAQAKIDDAKKKLSDIEKAKWTILDRKTIVAGYHDLKSGADTICSIAAVFPLFFILIVILMTSNTMARMIAEERSELGTLTSLGYNNAQITVTYLLYVLSATVFGAVTGYFIGCTIIPKIIFACFPYVFPPLLIHYDFAAFFLILAVAVLLMTAVTVTFCMSELKQHPATLMRPIPPKNGQTIVLERIGFIWNHLSFTWKVTMRNIFRFKQRVFMTIIGVAGCTALLLTGFGVKDSINGVAQKQYGEILRYQDLMVLKNDTKEISGNLKSLFEKEKIQNPVLISQNAFTCESGGKSLDSYLIVPESETNFYQYFHLADAANGTDLKLNDNGVIISQKISEAYNVGKGGKLTVKDGDHNAYTLTVSGVAENYIENYIYMNKALYSKVLGKSTDYNMVVSNDSGNEKTLAKHLLDSGLIISVNFQNDILQQANKQYSSLNSVVILIVCIASLLAVIVLYNLTSINISERKREIATLKVLGFYDGETNEYIYREAAILTLISIAVGLVLGIGLHHFVMSQIERESIVYFKNIKVLSFVWAFLITMVFSGIMQVITYFKLKKIDMIESLKSVE